MTIKVTKPATKPFEEVIAKCEVSKQTPEVIESDATNLHHIGFFDIRLLKQLLVFIQEEEIHSTSVEIITVSDSVNSHTLLGLRTKEQSNSTREEKEMYLIAPILQHHDIGDKLIKRFKDVPKDLYVKLPVYEETGGKVKTKTPGRFDLIREIIEECEEGGGD